ncbi:hypothetical protein KP806_22480 [Paenibacillus sp. N4]|uniref:hypothetical protein n=1 Tax=Paenibacillus vietnamensis TaxID=2590547 RepID=UPI001CD08153|nr:hypothetical protein [Paenibacillus vietnamensis]MCA0757832.1 hypothetical protein [Paenibacillus vietnamensis]
MFSERVPLFDFTLLYMNSASYFSPKMVHPHSLILSHSVTGFDKQDRFVRYVHEKERKRTNMQLSAPKTDPRIIRSKTALREALLRLMAQISFSAVTVTDIVDLSLDRERLRTLSGLHAGAAGEDPVSTAVEREADH